MTAIDMLRYHQQPASDAGTGAGILLVIVVALFGIWLLWAVMTTPEEP